MLDHVRTLLREPRVPDPPGVSKWDRALVVLLTIGGVVSGFFEPDVAWPLLAAATTVVVVPMLILRRRAPLAAALIALGTELTTDVITQAFTNGTSVSFGAGIASIILIYHLFRWASGREVALGSGLLLVWQLLSAIAGDDFWEQIGGLTFWLFTGSVGLALRYRHNARRRGIEEARATERERLARELHDTVAHHVSAIVIQAQAGRAQAAKRPEAAAEVLGVIEEAASRTLTDMRRMVGALRDSEPAALAPQAGVADIERMAADVQRPPVEVVLAGDLDDLDSSLDASLYRIAQESITNARRHARNATRIVVRVDGHDDHVQLPRLRRRRGGPAGAGLRFRVRAGRHGRTSVAVGWQSHRRSPRRRRLAGGRHPASNGRIWFMTRRVLLADDQELIRAGFRMILEAQDPPIEVIGEAANGREAVELARRLRPDVCLLDIRMPEMDGIEATQLLAGPGVADPMAVVIVTTFDLDEYVHGALKAGARGFLLKDAGPELLVQAIEAAAEGDALISPSITARLLESFSAGAASPEPRQPIDPLTEREEEVLLTVARGRTNAEIAEELYIGLSTVKTHIASLMTKLGARNRVEIAMWAYETGRMGRT